MIQGREDEDNEWETKKHVAIPEMVEGEAQTEDGSMDWAAGCGACD